MYSLIRLFEGSSPESVRYRLKRGDSDYFEVYKCFASIFFMEDIDIAEEDVYSIIYCFCLRLNRNMKIG